MALETLIFSLARWALIAVSAWWIAGFALWWLALQRQSVATGELARRLALPGSRQLATAIAAAGLIVVPACSTGQPTPQLTYVGEAGEAARVTETPLSTTLPSTTLPSTTTLSPASQPPTTLAPEPAATQPPTDEPPPIEPSRPLVHEVAPGEHLWAIAAAQLTAADDSKPTDTEIARYWRRLITTNAETIRSGDPNLIYPGEQLTLPPTDAS